MQVNSDSCSDRVISFEAENLELKNSTSELLCSFKGVLQIAKNVINLLQTAKVAGKLLSNLWLRLPSGVANLSWAGWVIC